MSGYDYSYYVMLERWLMGFKGATVPTHIKVIAEELYSPDILKLRNKVCPFCGRKFRKRCALYVHLVRGLRYRKRKCHLAFSYMLDEIIGLAKKASHAVKCSKGSYIVVTGPSPYIRCETKDEAIRTWLRLEGVR